MNTELLTSKIADLLIDKVCGLNMEDISKCVQNSEEEVINEIQEVLRNEDYSDFDAIEEIVCIFEKYGLDAGSRHDF
ncbi:MAG: hypothetical protein ACI38A_03675 [Candidatus Ornithomonoglobus sp.]